VQCRNCHRIAGKGVELGPDLSQVGKKLDKAKILDNILQPSASIDPKYAGWLVETKSGQVITGLLVKRDDAEIVIKDMQNKEHRLAADDVEAIFPQRKSLMPDLLLRDFTIEQVADLLAYLASLK
jgi:putative heme-binding domain-containing protein